MKRAKPKPGPLWRDVGRVWTCEVEPGEWVVTVGIQTPTMRVAENYQLPDSHPTEGAALEAGKAWAEQRNLFTTWASLTLRQRES